LFSILLEGDTTRSLTNWNFFELARFCS